MKKISVHRVSDKKGARDYTPITNKILQGEHLTFGEVGLLCYLLSLPISFTVVQKNILKQCKGRISSGCFRAAWKGLVEKGYIIKLIYYRNNLRREGWEVFENPDNREFQNQEPRKSLPLESKQIENKNVESKELETNNIGPNILGDFPRKIKMKSQIDALKENFDTSLVTLLDASSIGEEIFDYLDSNKFPDLIERIGKEAFKKIELHLLNCINIIKQLGK